MPRLFSKKEKTKPEEVPKPEGVESKEEKTEEKKIGTIIAVNQQTGFYVIAKEGDIPCTDPAIAKMLSILLKIEQQL